MKNDFVKNHSNLQANYLQVVRFTCILGIFRASCIACYSYWQNSKSWFVASLVPSVYVTFNKVYTM